MDYSEALNFIHSLGKFTLPPSLDRIKKVLKILGNPQDKFKAIHIAGTNGKGSTSAMLASVFETAGYKTGLFISPFIINFRERIQINGEYISEQELIKYVERVKKADVVLNEFEFITSVAFLFFAEQNIDILICETGLGGRLDATNALGKKIACVITKIGLDHTAVLGNTVEEIAMEKCGIIKDCPVVTTPYQNEKALAVIKKNALKLFIPNLNELEILKADWPNNTYIYRGLKYSLSLCGEFQIENALTAIEAVNSCGLNVPQEYIIKGINKTVFPARMEIVSKSPLIVIDGAHNPDGAKILGKELSKLNNVVAIIGAMSDKDYEQVLKLTLPYCKFAVAVAVKDLARSLSADELSKTASKYCKCSSASNYADALALAEKMADNAPIFVFGSLYLAADIRKIFTDKK